MARTKITNTLPPDPSLNSSIGVWPPHRHGRYRMVRPAACDEFFKLHDNEVFRARLWAVLLPPHSVPTSRSPNSGGAVIEAFPHGLAYGNMMTVLMGYFALEPGD